MKISDAIILMNKIGVDAKLRDKIIQENKWLALDEDLIAFQLEPIFEKRSTMWVVENDKYDTFDIVQAAIPDLTDEQRAYLHVVFNVDDKDFVAATLQGDVRWAYSRAVVELTHE